MNYEVQHREADVFYIDDEQHRKIAEVHVSKNEYETYGPDTLYIHHLYIQPEYRGKGLLKYLVQAVSKKYGNFPMTIHAEAYGDIGLPDDMLYELYERMGFRFDTEMYESSSHMMVRLPNSSQEQRT